MKVIRMGVVSQKRTRPSYNCDFNVWFFSQNNAALSGQKEIVELLIAKGADVNAMRFDGTPLHLAIGHKEIIKILIAKGADVNSKSKAFNQTPIDAAADNKFFNFKYIFI